ncbi:hypothetical protein LOTGIDRAFT_171191 [Lottia gigantea]|uniref:C-type lectin domain-containing protein n=1 Tax=Lottia gigantea TaxID=225164 RepID=V4CMR9_LOTGI|nr:hypothetical protein LOTGIDRAFT_171191 [Lottia gigantea]ESP03660.1 hypothetical protein LOTGIDRAFT_171191 [Lottia gigantea]
MDVLKLILLNFIGLSGINSRFITNPSPLVSSYCGSTYYFLNETHQYKDAISRCMAKGYDGLAVLIRPEQNQLAKSVIKTESNNKSKEVWMALEYHEPVWQWKRDDVWLNVKSQFNISWANNEPNNFDKERCCRVTYNPTTNPQFQWRSIQCTARNYFALCQKTELPFTRHSLMELYWSNGTEPTGTEVYMVKSVFECMFLCLEQCTCTFTYHCAGTCHIVTGNITAMKQNIGPGTYYKKT